MKRYLFSLLLFNSVALCAMNTRLKNTKHYLSDSAEEGDLKRVKQLLDEGIGVDQRRDRGFPIPGYPDYGPTALYVACEKGFQEMALLLLKKGADPTIMTSFSEKATPLHYAIKNRMLSVCEVIVINRASEQLPTYSKKSYKRIINVLCCFSLEETEQELPKECIFKIMSFDKGLCRDVLKMFLSKKGDSLEKKNDCCSVNNRN